MILTQANLDSLEEMLAGPPGLACFDFDNTLIQGDLGESVMYYILMQGLIAGDLPEFWQQLNHPCIAPEDVETWKRLWSIYKDQEDAFSYEKIAHGLIEAYESIAEKSGLEAAYRWTCTIFCGSSEEELAGIARHVFEENQLPGLAPLSLGAREIDNSIRVRRTFQNLTARLMKAGWEVRVITASPECTIRYAANKAFGIDEQNVRGMRLAISNGILMPQIIEPMTFDSGKVKALREITDRPIDFAAGDSFTDLAILDQARHTLLVDRGNQKLREHGESKGWWIIPALSIE
ncbi:MAG TPA: haloacid dehalogenase-like hydrolase [Leptospiraceae bacterium]|nr:haloacid dehalogenase-like hydrolase [Leptospiraceae bacterium]